MITLGFHGAAGTVTGSKYLLTVNGSNVLIDCGMFQGAKWLRERNWVEPPFAPADVDAVILTHAHIDHVGYLPRLTALGFSGPVYATPPTAEIAGITLRDTAHLQTEDAEFRNKKKLTSHAQALPLFTVEDAEEALTRFRTIRFGQWVEVAPGIRFRYHIVGHLLGAAFVETELSENDRTVRLLFSGDIGRYDHPLVRDPMQPTNADYLVCESTYGGRTHGNENPEESFADLVTRAVREKRVLLVPAFAIGRTQQVVYIINQLVRQKRIPPIDIHIDSPMAVSATRIYIKYRSYHDLDVARLGGSDCLLHGSRVHLHRKRTSSKRLNKLRGPAVIISAGGMLTGGRILHHLLNRLHDERTTVVFVGFMAEGTLGRRLAEGAKQVYIHKLPVDVRAEIVSLSGLSGHADYREILRWLRPLDQPPQQVFITHGEPSQSQALADRFASERGWACRIPALNDVVEL